MAAYIYAIVLALVCAASILVGVILARLAVLWFEAKLDRADIDFFVLVGMRLRKVDAKAAVRTKTLAVKADIPVSYAQIEGHMLAGGNPWRVVEALVVSKQNNLGLDWSSACAIDLAGKDVYEYACQLEPA